VVYTDDSGVISPADETFQPDPEQIDTGDLTEAKAQSFIQAIRANCDLSPEQIADLYQTLGIEPPTEDIKTRFKPAVKSIEISLEAAISEDTISVAETLTPPTIKSKFPKPPGYGRPSPDEIDTVCLITGLEDTEREQLVSEKHNAEHILVITLANSRASKGQSSASLIHSISFTETHITAWSVRCSRELTWEVRSRLFDQIGTLLPMIVEALSDSETTIADAPGDFDISFSHEDREVISY
jgi:hypothetical protein